MRVAMLVRLAGRVPALREDGQRHVTHIGHGPGESFLAWSVEPADDLGHEVFLEQLGLAQGLPTAIADSDQDNAAVVGDANPVHEAALLHSVHDSGRARHGHVEDLGQPAHREVAVLLEDPHQVEVGHADPGTNEPDPGHAPELPDRAHEFGEDLADPLAGSRRGRAIRSGHVNYSTDTDSPVNTDHPRHRRD